MEIKVSISPEIFIKRAFWLAWLACEKTTGLGFLKDRPDASEEDVWNNVKINGDYPINHNKRNEFYADYVFGRMMKWGCEIKKEMIYIQDKTFNIEYQSFSIKYKDNQSLINETAKSIGCTFEIIK
jgi:hypothetical protein